MKDRIISTPAGLLRGTDSEHGSAFLGIPYASGVHGANRFAAPISYPTWSGVRDATSTSASAPQPDRSKIGDLDLSYFFAPGWQPGNEYLTVSVQTPNTSGNAPVVVYLHGGAFIAGSNAAGAYDGSTFSRDGVVFVGVNYRLGIPGFLRLPDAPDNRGLLDVIAALRWVQDSIRSFGGDPERVTVMGQSAGAILVLAILGRADTEGLFARAIAQSGTALGGLSVEQADRVAASVAKSLGVPATVSGLADVDDAELLRAAAETSTVDLLTSTSRPPMDGIVRFGVVTNEPLHLALTTGPGSSRPLLVGSNIDEAALYPDPANAYEPQLSEQKALTLTATRLSSRPEELLKAYRAEQPDLSLEALRLLIRSDGMFGFGTRLVAVAHAATAPTYLYEFDWRSNALEGQLGASHLMELPFVFDHATVPELRGKNAPLGTAPLPEHLASRMHKAWVAYIRDADPGWPAYRPGARVVQRIGNDWALETGHRATAMDVWGI